MPQQESAEHAFNKLTRTFTDQVEALKNYRSNGEQKMTVQHVRVAEGGRRSSATSTRRRGEGRARMRMQPHALGYAAGIEMPRRRSGAEKAPIANG